jgi:ferredoxin, 2Fe-2S
MGTLIVKNRAGDELSIKAEGSRSLMEIMREGGVEEILALCGGTCSCATCHVIVDPAFAGRLEPMSGNEDEMLDSCEQRTPTSRLSCQIPYRDELDGLRLTVAQDD